MADEPTPPPSGNQPVLDLRAPATPGDVNQVQLIAAAAAIDQHSTGWAEIVRPFTFCFLGILVVAMFLPFLFVWTLPRPLIKLPNGSTPEIVNAAVRAALDERSRTALDWAKTILPSAVGFGSAIVGYYFGTRSSSRAETPTTAASGSREQAQSS